MNRTRALLALSAVLSLVWLAAAPVAAAPKGRVVVALGTDTSTMDPHMHTERVGIIINQHIFDKIGRASCRERV